MKQAIKVIEEIQRCKTAIRKTKSKQLKYQYGKHISRQKKALKEYCYYKGYDYKTLVKGE